MKTMQRRKFRWSGLAIAIVVLASVCGQGSAARADDIVRVAHESDGSIVEIVGEIVSYDRKELSVQTASRRPRQFATPLVLSTKTELSPHHKAARRHLDRGEWSEAVEELRMAIQDERRNWVRQAVFRDLAFAYRFANDLEQSAATALALYREFPRTYQLDVLPLVWDNGRLDQPLQRKAIQWLDSKRPEEQLLAASWLLSGASRSASRQRLQRLTDSWEGWIAQLATAQLWRMQMDRATTVECERWARLIARMPPELRAGPLTVLGRAWRQAGQPETAAITLMKVPILHTDERELAVASLMQVAKLVPSDEQNGVYREVVDTFPYSAEASMARRQLRP